MYMPKELFPYWHITIELAKVPKQQQPAEKTDANKQPTTTQDFETITHTLEVSKNVVLIVN